MLSKPVTSILFLTKYSRKGASSRYRSLQYIPYLEEAGFQCVVSPLFDDKYLEHLYQTGRGRFIDYVYALFSRFMILFQVRHFDLVVIEKEVFPYFPAVAEWFIKLFGYLYIVDYDDALFHQYDNHPNWLIRKLFGKKITKVMQRADLVIAGNRYLADYGKQAKAKRVEVIPTVVDLKLYKKRSVELKPEKPFTIGWIGSPSTTHYLQSLALPLKEFCSRTDSRLLVVGARDFCIEGVSIENRLWSMETEIENMLEMDVGIMPLPDEPWERGKCGLKLIQYMACSLPVVASPVGVNSLIVSHGRNGFLASDPDSWIRAFTELRVSLKLRKEMGAKGRIIVERNFSIIVTAPKLIQLFEQLISHKSVDTGFR